jgi:secretion system chaperone SscA
MKGNQELYQQWQDYLAQGGSLRKLRQLPSTELDKLYTHGYHCYQQGSYKVAKNFFYLLSALDQWRFDYQLGLGLCYQRLGEYQEAANTFSQAALIRMDDPRPPYCCGLSYQRLGEFERAKQAFQAALKWCVAHPEMPEVKQAAENLLAGLTLRSSL